MPVLDAKAARGDAPAVAAGLSSRAGASSTMIAMQLRERRLEVGTGPPAPLQLPMGGQRWRRRYRASRPPENAGYLAALWIR